MLSFESGVSYLRKEARVVGLVADSDTDDVLIEKVSQMIRKWGRAAAAALAEAAKEAAAASAIAKKVSKKKVSKKTA